jgi:hypothetical protein
MAFEACCLAMTCAVLRIALMQESSTLAERNK